MQTMKALANVIGLTLVVSVFGQSATDHPNLKSGNARTGVNGNVSGSMPGYLRPETVVAGVPQGSALRWLIPQRSYRPLDALRLNEVNPFRMQIDNTDALGAGSPAATNLDEAGNVVGPFDPNPIGVTTSNSLWNTVTSNQEADYALQVPVRRNRNLANPAAFQGRDFNNRFPSLVWAPTTSSSAGVNGDPRIPINLANLQTWTWTYTPRISTNVGTVQAPVFTLTNDTTPKDLAVYVWLPVGPIRPTALTRRFQARYQVYEITYAGGQKYVDVVDTWASGGGYVRLGNGGRPTNQVFPYDGLNPISVTLYNTIPRNDQDQLMETVNGANPDNRFAVYADAVMFSTETDSYSSTPTSAGFGGTDIRVTGALNERLTDPTTIPSLSSTDFKAKPTTVGRGVVTSYDHNTGNVRWKYSPNDATNRARYFENTDPRFALTAGVIAATDNPNARSGEYLTTPATTAVAATENVTLNPDTDLNPGSYEIEMYVGGDVTTGPINYAQRAEYQIIENGGVVGTFTLDMSGPAGWKRIGVRRYAHSVANPLQIVMTNRSPLAGDAGKPIYVDQFRFIGNTTTEFMSTPVHTRAFIRLAPAAAPVETNVVIVADENGRLHCLDATGNGDGTTTCYWTYPSERTLTADPNLEPGQDPNDPNFSGPSQKFDGETDTLIASMPTRFDLSTAVVHRESYVLPGPVTVNRDMLTIGSVNGRVYTIAMEGRGDFNAATKLSGTTFRTWTYPATYPTDPAQNTALGAISSVVYANATVGGVVRPVVFVGTEQGRMYCLDALGDFNYSGANLLNTTVLWQYPPATSETLPAIEGAPVYDATNNRLFFGTQFEDGKGANLVAMNVDTGAPLWTSITDGLASPPTVLDWRSGAAYVSNAQLTDPAAPGEGSLTALTTPDCLYAMNENGWVYAINAADGSVVWRTNELQSGGQGSIIFSHLTTQGRAGGLANFPVIFVPTASGKLAALFARLDEHTRFATNPLTGNRQAWGYNLNDKVQASMTVSNRWLYGASTNGYLLAWSDVTNPGGFLPFGFFGPGSDVIPDNNQDSLYEEYRNTEVAFLSREGYLRLRKTTPGTSRGQENFGTVIDTAAAYSAPLGRLLAPFRSTHGNAFEWGETIYMLVYNFPMRTTNPLGDDVPPPTVEVTINSEGNPGRTIVFESKLFADKSESDTDGGYAVVQIPLTSGGNTSQVPGPGAIKVGIKTSATTASGAPQSITLNPARSTINYQVANPLAIVMNTPSVPLNDRQLGYTIDPSREDALLNGSSNVAVSSLSSTILGASFGQSTGVTGHGQSKRTTLQVFDRSLITLQRGEGRGLDNVKVDRRDLRWQGGASTVTRPFSSLGGALATLFNNYEDLPVTFPNISLDYPDLRREQVKVRKDPNGNVENPVFGGVTLNGPRVGTAFVDETNADTRSLIPTVFEFQVDVPKYQPTNIGASSIPSHTGPSWFAGYAGRFTVYVDSDQDQRFGGLSREANRSFNLATAVAPDTKLVVGTPNVDLGSLAAGAGYDAGLAYLTARPYRTLSPTTLFNPTSATYSGMFKPFSVFNEGNVNALNVRLAKGTAQVSGGGISLYWPWQLLSTTGNDQVWLDTATDVHTELDRNFAPELGSTGLNYVVVQKPRVGDSRGRQLQVNPSSRLNPNLNNSGAGTRPAGDVLNPALLGLRRDPRITVTPPLGTPVGQYSQMMRVLDDTAGVGPVAGFNDESVSLGYVTSSGAQDLVMYEAYSDPGFTVSFRVKETQLTGGRSQYTSAIIHEGYAGPNTQWSDIQPTGTRRRNGNLTMAFASNRPTIAPAAPVGIPPQTRNFNIYVSTVPGSPMGAPDGRGEDSHLRDLNLFTPANPGAGRWAGLGGSVDATVITTLFGNVLTNGVPNSYDIGGTVVPTENRLAHPSFPTNGDRNPDGSALNNLVMAMVGSTKRQTSTGLINDSRIMAVHVGPTGSIVNTPVTLDFDPTLEKGRPSVVQFGIQAWVFFTARGNGTSSLYVAPYTLNGGFGAPVALRLGAGFDSISDPSVTISLNAAGGLQYNVVFSARLRGSSISEVFMVRFGDNGAGGVNPTPITFGVPGVANGALVEGLVFDNRLSAYRSRGVNWSSAATFSIVTSNGASIFADAAGNPTFTPTGSVDRETGLQSYPTIFGGRVVVDTALGLVKFTNAQLPKAQTLTLSYVPSVLRISSSNAAGYAAPTLIQDERLAPSNTTDTPAFWFTPSGAFEPANSGNTFSHRFVLGAVRGTAAGGQVSRPIMASFRYGVRVGRAILANANGTLAEAVTVTGNNFSYQVDPVGGRIFFDKRDENRIVRIRVGSTIDITRPVSIVGESSEEFVPIESALNEANFSLFMDPVGDLGERRELIWMLWSSSRNGAPNLFMQTMARKLTPHGTGN